MVDLPPELRRILADSFFIRTTMIRRSNNRPRTVETTYYWDGADKVIISGYPGKRDWVATMAVNTDVTLHTVESEPWYDIPARARVVRDRRERVPYLLKFIDRWTVRPGFPRRRFQIFLGAVKVNRALRLPWWGPFWFARRIFDQMPCVEVTMTGSPIERRAGGPPPLSEPNTHRP